MRRRNGRYTDCKSKRVGSNESQCHAWIFYAFVRIFQTQSQLFPRTAWEKKSFSLGLRGQSMIVQCVYRLTYQPFNVKTHFTGAQSNILDTVFAIKHTNDIVTLSYRLNIFFSLQHVMHRIYLPTRKDTRYPYSSIAYLYSSEYVDKVKTQHALSGTCARFIQETHTHTHTHTHIRWCYTFTWKLPHLAELEVFRLERLRDELVLLGPELRGCRRGRHGRQAVQHLTNIKLLHFPRCERRKGIGAPSRDQPWMMKENAALARFCSTSL